MIQKIFSLNHFFKFKGGKGEMILRLIKKIFSFFYIPVAANIPLLMFYFYKNTRNIFLTVIFSLLIFSLWIYLNLFPHRKEEYAGKRLRIMIGGRTLCLYSFYGFLLQTGIIIFLYPLLKDINYNEILWFNGLYAFGINFFLFLNGIIRIFFTSKWLSFRKRILLIFTIWIPVINILILFYTLRIIKWEYEFECYKASLKEIRAESDICKTKYPIILVHGVGFRDSRHFNYWGRIPRELMRYGVSIYYGNQEAFGTIEYNGEDIKKKILEVIKETGSKKVNIIAHSKGGLDSRYAISILGMDKYTASLTTISTPHRGCLFVDKMCKLPERIYRGVAKFYDNIFKRLGDKNPDFYSATHQFTTYSSEEFNKNVVDSTLVYYQSYISIMKDCFSDILLTIPYFFIKILEGENDGLVSISSAKWGTFKGVIKNEYHRGISHGDIIDLKRQDYKGFDVVEFYVQLVSELKKMGF